MCLIVQPNAHVLGSGGWFVGVCGQHMAPTLCMFPMLHAPCLHDAACHAACTFSTTTTIVCAGALPRWAGDLVGAACARGHGVRLHQLQEAAQHGARRLLW